MPLEILSRFLWRAPLLPVAALDESPRSLFARGVPALAVAVAQPPPQALPNFARRAAFRPTPHALWAGVGVGTLGARTRGKSGPLRAALTVGYARLAALARARLDDPEWRARVRLRVAPSLFADETRLHWLALGQGASAAAQTIDADEMLARLCEAARDWQPWTTLARLADEQLLLSLVDDGLLVSDLLPPLVGPPPLSWLSERDRELQPVAAALARGDVTTARAQLAALPGEGDLHAVLVHEGALTLSRAAVERAARLGPLLFRVQEALMPPLAERELDPALAAALAGITELFGVGAYGLGPLALGRWGTPLDAGSDAARPAAAASMIAYVAGAIAAAARAGADEVALDPATLDALAPSLPGPPTFELFVTPMREPRSAAPGTGWLVGLHAPAGATWGRFAHALGAPLDEAFAELCAREPSGSVDVAYAPSAALGDLCAQPPLRARALALSTWPDARVATVTPDELALVADAALPEPLTLAHDGEPLVPAPAWRVRSTTAPPGAYRLLTGFSLVRQHAPWALPLGPLAQLPWTPRLSVDDFVVSPQSWRIPTLPDRRALTRWRRELKVPRHIQVGHEDELLLVDLDRADALAQLQRLPADEDERPRAWEVWPPLSALVDAGGRRVEAVIAVVDRDPLRDAARTQAARSPSVPLPEQSRAPDWLSLKLFGPADRAEHVLLTVIAPLVDELRQQRRLHGWFFLPYVDGPGHRDHLRLRLCTPDHAHAQARLEELLQPARSDGSVVTVERGEYHRELGRYGADAMPAVERVFEADSDLVLSLLAAAPADEEGDDLAAAIVSSYDALARGAGLDVAARAALARRRRDAFGLSRDAGDPQLRRQSDALAVEFRRRQSALRRALARPSAPFAAHAQAIARALAELPISRRETLLPALLHLAAVRLAGPARAPEAGAIYLWERTLESLLRHAER